MAAVLTLNGSLWRTARRRFYRSPIAPFLQAWLTDSCNRIRYGPGAPRFAERYWIDPRTVQRCDRNGLRWKSGQVVTGAWRPRKERPIEADAILQTSIARWVDGKSWEESGEVERMEKVLRTRPGHAGCYTRDDILRRCARLDEIFHSVAREGRLRSITEVDPRAFRELDGIGMHIGPNGEPIRAQNGRHRFAIAWILRIPLIPVRVGLVHHSALPLLNELRQQPRLVPAAAPRARFPAAAPASAAASQS